MAINRRSDNNHPMPQNSCCFDFLDQMTDCFGGYNATANQCNSSNYCSCNYYETNPGPPGQPGNGHCQCWPSNNLLMDMMTCCTAGGGGGGGGGRIYPPVPKFPGAPNTGRRGGRIRRRGGYTRSMRRHGGTMNCPNGYTGTDEYGNNIC